MLNNPSVAAKEGTKRKFQTLAGFSQLRRGASVFSWQVSPARVHPSGSVGICLHWVLHLSPASPAGDGDHGVSWAGGEEVAGWRTGCPSSS